MKVLHYYLKTFSKKKLVKKFNYTDRTVFFGKISEEIIYCKIDFQRKVRKEIWLINIYQYICIYVYIYLNN